LQIKHFAFEASILPEKCGIPAFPPNVARSYQHDLPKIVGGMDTIKNSWPWMVNLEINDRLLCGASLINRQVRLMNID
jgi:hypothetical protein